MKGTYYLKVMAFALAITVFSCGKDDGPDTPDPVAQAPEITSFLPASGPVGTTVEISGKNFSATKADNAVKFNGQVASVQLAATTKLTVQVPNGATDGAITVQVGDKTATSSSAFDVAEEVAEELALSKDLLTLYPYPFYATSLEVTTNTSGQSVSWSSSDEAVAMVSATGEVTPISIGSAVITATAGSVSAQCTVTVENGPVSELTLDITELSLYRDGEQQISIATLVAAVELTSTPVWYSGDESIATVDQNGNVTAVDVGTTEITLTVDNAVAICKVTVRPDIYISGSKEMDVVVWKNGEEYLSIPAMTEGQSAKGTSIYVDGTDILIGGYDDDGDTARARGWKNGELLFSLGGSSAIQAVTVNNGEVHFAGYELDGKRIARVWNNNGTPTDLSDGTNDAFVNAAYSFQGKIYFAGRESNGGILNNCKLWEIGQLPVDLEEGLYKYGASGSGIYVDETSLYVAGSDYDENDILVAKIWNQQGELHNLSNGEVHASARSLHGEGSVLVAGGFEIIDNLWQANLWIVKDNIISNTKLGKPGTESVVYSAQIVNGKIYATGYEVVQGVRNALLWIVDSSGNLMDEIHLSEDLSMESIAYSIQVK